MAWDLTPGEVIRRTAIHARHKGNSQRGITRSSIEPVVLIFSDPAHGEQHGYYDHWEGDVFHYAGEGQRGDQTLSGGNAAILRHAEEGRALRVFEGVSGAVRYLGEFELDANPYYWMDTHDTDGRPRKVIMFRLRPIGEVPPDRRHAIQ